MSRQYEPPRESDYQPPPLYMVTPAEIELLARRVKDAAEAMGIDPVESDKIAEEFLKRLP